MPAYRYQALDVNLQPVAGDVQADSLQQAIAQLEAAGLSLQSIGIAGAETARFDEGASTARRDAGAAPLPDNGVERAAIQAHLANVLERCGSLVPALRAYADELSPGPIRHQLRTVCRIVEQGNAEAAATSLSTLPEYWIPLLSAAAASHDPGLVLRQFLNESHRAEELRRQRRRVLAYPLVVCLLAISVFVILSIFVIGSFRQIFEDFDLNLPQLTLWVLGAAEFAASQGGAIAAALTLVLLIVLWATARGRLGRGLATWFGDRFGAIFGNSTANAQFAQFTGDLLDAGVDAASALRIAGYATRRPSVRQAGWRLADDVQRGAIGNLDRYWPPLSATLVQAMRISAPTPSRARLLKEISRCHGDRAGHRLSWTYGLIEPALIGGVGLVIGVVVLALFVPLVDLVNNLAS